MRRMLIGFLGAASASCTSTYNYTPTMASDPPVLGNEASLLRTAMLRALEEVPADGTVQSDLCHVIPESYQNRQRWPVRNLSAELKAKTCYRFRDISAGPAKDAEVKSYLTSGIALSDYYCSVFFERIAQHASKRRFARSGVNDAGAAITALLGFASAGSAVTGGIGAGFGLFDSTFRNYDEAFLVHEDLPALQKLVTSEQVKFKNSLFADANSAKVPRSFEEATGVINDYARNCTFTGMRSLLNESMIEKAQKAANPLDQSRIFNPAEISLQNWKKIQDYIKQEKAEASGGSADAEEMSPND